VQRVSVTWTSATGTFADFSVRYAGGGR
jgi:hypothetical protein